MENLEVKIKLEEGGIIPKKMTENSNGYDVYTPAPVYVKPGRQIIPLAFSIELPKGFEAKIEARSGFSAKGMEGHRIKMIDDVEYDDKGNMVSHTQSPFVELCATKRFDCDVIPGKVDSDYRGIVGVIIKNNDKKFFIPAKTRIAQMTIYKAEEANFVVSNELSETKRDDGGFGHSGSK